MIKKMESKEYALGVERMDREFGGSPYGWLMDRQYVKVYNYQGLNN